MAPICFRWPLGLLLLITLVSNSSAKKHSKHPISKGQMEDYLRTHRTFESEHDYFTPRTNEYRRANDSSAANTKYGVQFPAFDKNFYLSLERSQSARYDKNMVIKHIGKHGKTRITSPRQGCYLHGKYPAHKKSRVGLNFCGKKSGMIQADNAYYDVMPLTDEHAQTVKVHRGSVETPTHIIEKRQAMVAETCVLNTRRPLMAGQNRQNRRTRKDRSPVLEISIVADDSLHRNHANETETYILNIFHQVAALFQDKSLAVSVKFHIIGLTILESPQTDLPLGDELSHVLATFCEWQKKGKSDITVLITGKDLQTGGQRYVTGKASDVAGACKPLKRCVVAEDNGPTGLVLTLTHEIGHSIGMYHDDAFSDCQDDHYIMSPTESMERAPKWSSCSNRDLVDFLDSPSSSCLDNEPEVLPHMKGEKVLLQGMHIDHAQQCRLLHGEHATSRLDRSVSVCDNLPCRFDGKDIVSDSLALDGTQCGHSKRQICLKGSCVNAYSTQLCSDNPGGECTPEWLPERWSTCNNCSQTRNIYCVQYREDDSLFLIPDDRMCPEVRPITRRPCCNGTVILQNEYFIGAYQDCSVSCGSGLQSRIVQCRSPNGTNLADAECEGPRPDSFRACIGLPPCPSGDTYLAFAGPFLECSRSCGPGTQSRTVICIMNNAAQVDLAQCIANGIEIPETEQPCNLGPCPSEAFSYITGPFTECTASCGGGTQMRLVVCLNSTSSRVDIENCQNAGLGTPPETQDCNLDPCPAANVFIFVAENFPECTITCGTAVITRDVTCQNQDGVIVPDQVCLNLGQVKPDTESLCVQDECPSYGFITGDYGECSVSCDVGVRVRPVTCVNQLTNETVADMLCSESKPSEFGACSEGPCPSSYRYVAGEFGECNCDGVSSRIVICVSVTGISFSPVNDSLCTASGLEPIPSTRDCTPPTTCSTPVWTFTEWSECSASCGSGRQTRRVYCIASPGSTEIVDNSECVAEDRPIASQICSTECPPAYVWLATEFGPCSVTCGEGFRTRSVFCYSVGDNDILLPVVSANCLAEDEPESVTACTEGPCNGVFVATPWSECSVSCGQGVRTRTITCSRTKATVIPIPISECDPPIPPDRQDCYLEPCPSIYGCDVSYDASAPLSTTISSPNYPDEYPSDLECLTVIRAPVGTHIEITFTDFVLEPGCDYDYLLLIDVENNFTETRFCDDVPMLPFTYQSVGREVELILKTDVSVQRRGYTGSFRAVTNDIIMYVPGPWSQCDVSCGEGIQSRDLSCVLNGELVDLLDCSGLERPSSVEPCFNDPCPGPDFCDDDVLRTQPGTISSPGFPNNYPSNTTCSNLIIAPEGEVVQLTLQFMRMEGTPNCEKDALLVSEALGEAVPLHFCGEYETQVIFRSLTNQVRVVFVSDDTVEDSGYQLTFDFVTPIAPACGTVIRNPGQVITSPGYPEPSNRSQECSIGILNTEGCIELVFTDLDVSDEVDCDNNYISIEDPLNAVITRKICGREIPTPFLSVSASIRLIYRVTADTGGRGYSAIPRFVDCPEAVRIPSEWTPCSVSCGEGVQRRNVTCIDSLTQIVVDDDLCDGPDFETERPCTHGECPSCDIIVTGQQSGLVVFPPDADLYSNNQDCRITISNPSQCITILLVEFDLQLQPGVPRGLCNTDFVEIRDVSNPLVSLKLCDDPRPFPRFSSVSNNVAIDFHSDGSIAGKGFSFFPTFNDCPAFAFIPEPFGPCSASCDGGNRTRAVSCRNLATNAVVNDILCDGPSPYPVGEPCGVEPCPSCSRNLTEGGLLIGPLGEDGRYPSNAFCEYYISNPDGGCVFLSFLEFDLQEPNDDGVCSDYITIVDTEYPNAKESFCVNQTDLIISRGREFYVSFKSDDEGAAAGYRILINLNECPDFAYDVGVFGECSVSCGSEGGFFSRDVQCINVRNQEPVDDRLCPNVRPAATAPCDPEEECVSCDLVITASRQFLDSFNYPGNYDNNQECVYTITNPDSCIKIIFFIFSLDEGDSLQIVDDGYEGLTVVLRGEKSLRMWMSRTGDVTAIFTSDHQYNDGSFKLFIQFEDCPQFGYIAGEFSECSSSCGEGEMIRLIQCVHLESSEPVEDRLCNDPRPEGRQICMLDPCPTCDRYITDQDEDREISSPNFPVGYEPDTECRYDINSTQGRCINVFIISLDTEGPLGSVLEDRECHDLDGIYFVDDTFPYRSKALCGQASVRAEPLNSYGSSATLTFFSNDNGIVGAGFKAYVAFVDCEVEYAFSVGNFSECDASCGEAVQIREVVCIDIESGIAVNFTLCPEDPPPSVAPCLDMPECPSCDAFYNQTIIRVDHPGYPAPYQPRTECIYTLHNPTGGCLRIAFTVFDLGSDPDDCYDYLEISDIAYPTNDPVRYCPRETVPSVYHSLSSRVMVRFAAGDSSDGGSFLFFGLSEDCPTYGYVAGPYSECPITCGDVSQIRTVHCFNLSTGVVVPDGLCRTTKPPSLRRCHLPECPSCNEIIQTPVTLINSPGYSEGSYGPLTNCLKVIIGGDQCVSLFFADVDLEPRNLTTGSCDGDLLQISDTGNPDLDRTICGTELRGMEWLSRSGDVSLTFTSDLNGIEGRGFSIFSTFQDCPVNGFVYQLVGECSVSCGEGQQLRDVRCIVLETEEILDDSECMDPRPGQVEPCFLEECPICDLLIEDTGTPVTSENHPSSYPENQRCDFDFRSPDESCWNLFFTVLDFPPPDPETGVCLGDYLMLEEDVPYGRHERLCGFRQTFFLKSRSKDLRLTLVTDGVPTEHTGFLIAAMSLQECPMYGYATGMFGNCSKACGGGQRSRRVICINLLTGVEVTPDTLCSDEESPALTRPCNTEACPSCDQFFNETNSIIRSPNYPLQYEPDQVCRYRFVNPEGCVRVEFEDFDLQGPNEGGICDADYLEIADEAPQSEHLTRKYCGNEGDLDSWLSRSGSVRLTLSTDSSIERFGFSLRLFHQQCPTFGYVYTEWSECSVTCGSGIFSRDITCIQLTTGQPQNEGLCPEEPPAQADICTLGPCPSCDETILAAPTIITSPNYPMNYPNSANCQYTIYNPAGCIQLIFSSLDLQSGDDGCVDHLLVSDEGAPRINTEYCGSPMPLPPSWHSVSGNVTVTLTTDVIVDGKGFELNIGFVECSQYSFTVESGMCSMSCGGGMQNRTVYCQETGTPNVVDDSYCVEDKPAEIGLCNNEPCPIECGRAISEDTPEDDFINSPGYGFVEYENGLRCQNTIINFEGCISITIHDIDIEPGDTPGGCNNDYLLLLDPSYQYISVYYCGNVAPLYTWRSGFNVAQITLRTNDRIRGNGYSLSYNFLPSCPEFDFTVDEFSECSTSCGEGIQTRRSVCLNNEGGTLPFSFCRGARPDPTRACDPPNDPCPQFVSTPWSECNVTCGEGIQTRVSLCLDHNNTLLSIESCQGPSPDEIQPCALDECPQPVYVYQTGPYSACSQTCDEGLQSRDVFCVDNQTGLAADPSLCSGLTPPENMRPCIVQPCYRYEISPWTECSQSCGLGEETRTAVCVNSTNIPVLTSFCTGELPSTTRPCFVEECPVYNYTVSPWAECSVTCGNGTQTRNVTCEDRGRGVDISLCPMPAPIGVQECATGVICIDATCGDTVDASSGGTFASLGHPGPYPRDFVCNIIFRVTSGFRLNLRFDALDVQFGAGTCTNDYIQITGQESGASTFLCRPVTIPYNYYSHTVDRQVTLTLITDSDVELTGFYGSFMEVSL